MTYATDPSYRRTKSGRWEVIYYTHTPPTKRRCWKGGFRTRADAARWFAALATPAPDTLTLGAFVVRYLAHKRATVRAGTLESDVTTTRKLCAHFGESRALASITAPDVEQWLATLDGVSAHTVNGHLRRLRTALACAVRWGLLDANPALSVARRRTVEAAIVYLTRDEQHALVRAAREDGAAPYAYPLVVLALRTGLRRGELLSLRWRDVDLDRRQITVRTTDGALTKSGRSRVVGIDADAAEALTWWHEWFGAERAACLARSADSATEYHARLSAEYRAAWLDQCAPAPAHPVFPSFPVARLTPRVEPMAEFRKTWARVTRAAFGPRRRVRFHDLRHTFAVECARNGVPVALLSQLLGHSSLQVTQVYLRFAPDAGAAAALACVPALNCGHTVGGGE